MVEGLRVIGIAWLHLRSGARFLIEAAKASCACAETGLCLTDVLAGYLPR